jgi:hypothetical protein
MSNGTFDFNELIKESKEVLVNPKSYFSTMKTSGGMTEPLIKAVIYGAIAGVFSFLWSILHIGAAGAGMFGTAVGILSIVWSVVGAIIGLFVGAVILLVISAICKGSTDFESNLRVTAAVMVVWPISAFLGFAVGINLYLGTIVSLAVSVYSLWLLYNGLVETLKTKQETTKIVMLVLIALVVIVTLAGIRTANKFKNSFNNSDLQEMMKDVPKN